MICIYKKQGETPLQALKRLREKQTELKDETLSYAGRLDPMAEGVLLVLVGDENNNREKFLHQDKAYITEALFGFETDSYDILGKLVETGTTSENITQEKLEKVLERSVGTYEQPYPGFSSQPVNGKPLFEWAREGKLGELEIPSKRVTVYKSQLLEVHEISAQDLLNTIKERISKVQGDFRQEEIIKLWHQKLDSLQKSAQKYRTAKIRIACSSGTYVRSLVHELGKELGSAAIIYSLIRTKVGEKGLSDCIELEIK